VSDLVQWWPFDGLQEAAFALVPCWITYRLVSRNPIGWLWNRPDGKQSVVKVLDQMHDGTFRIELAPTEDRAVIKARLLDLVSPSAFQHLVCDLAQPGAPRHPLGSTSAAVPTAASTAPA
jgi:hypothetical protein